MVNAIHAILSKLFGDSFADVALTIIQWGAFAGIVYLAIAAIGVFNIALPQGMSPEEAIIVMLPLLVIAAPNTVD